MGDKIKVEKIVLNIKGTKLELSPEEAMELKKVLEDTLRSDGFQWYWYPYTTISPPQFPVITYNDETVTYTIN